MTQTGGEQRSGPRIWTLLGDKLGDNAQVQVIIDALGWPVEAKTLVFRPEFRQGKPRFKPSLYHLEPDASTPLEAPWPDIILTIGRRPSMAALWVREQSGGHSQIVIIGRPKRMLGEFALVVATPQYSMPDAPNVLRLQLPLMRADRDKVARAADAWQGQLASMRRPLTAVMVGGVTKPYVLDARTARDLAAGAVASSDGGSLYLTTSRRTPETVVRHLEGALPRGGRSFVWGRDPAGENPYQALLGSADRFIVTGDSISMMVEVVSLGKPLAIYALPEQQGMLQGLRRQFIAGERFGWLQRKGLVGFSRDLTRVHELLYERGLAVPLGEPFPSLSDDVIPDEVQQVVERIRELARQPQ